LFRPPCGSRFEAIWILFVLVLSAIPVTSVSAASAAPTNYYHTVRDSECPQSIAFAGSSNDLYVANVCSDVDGVTVINTLTNEPLKTIPLHSHPIAFAYDSTDGDIYMANYTDGSPYVATISVIATSTNTVVKTIPLPWTPLGLAFVPPNNEIYAADSNGNVYVIDTSTNKVASTIAVGSETNAIAFASPGYVYVTGYSGSGTSAEVSVIDTSTNTVVKAIQIQGHPSALAFSPFNNEMYVAHTLPHGSSCSNDPYDCLTDVIDTSTGTVMKVPVGNSLGITYDQADNEVYESNCGGQVFVIDATANIPMRPLNESGCLQGIAYSTSNKDVYVADISEPGGGVYWISTATPYPRGVLVWVPITITNHQSSPIQGQFDQMIAVDSSAYSSLEAYDLKNVEFFNSSGDVIPSWLESGNSNASTTTVYWLRLDGGIPAGSSDRIYMGLGSVSTSFFNTNTTGEAPQLSPTYGEYDDGNAVFPTFYDNFAGNSLNSTKWTNPDLIASVNDGVTLNSCSSQSCTNYYYLHTASKSFSLSTFDADVTSLGFGDYIGFVNPEYATHSAPHMYFGAFIRTASGYAYADQWNASGESGSPSSNYLIQSESAPGVYSENLLVLNSTKICSTGSLNYYSGNNPSKICSSWPNTYVDAGFVPVNSSISVQWARIRTSPPNNLFPVVTFGTVSSRTVVSCAQTSVPPQNSTECTAFIGGYSRGGNVVWSQKGTGNVSLSDEHCSSASGACSVTVTGFIQGYTTLTASYFYENPQYVLSSGSFMIAISDLTVTCSNAVIAQYSTCTGTVSGHSDTGNIVWSSSQGRFPTSSCTIHPIKDNISFSMCTVRFMPLSTIPPVTITAKYSGDAVLARAATEKYILTVNPQSSKTSISCSPAKMAEGKQTVVKCTAREAGHSPTGTVTWSSNNTAAVSMPSGTTCTLSSGGCQVEFTVTLPGTVLIQATYSGDPANTSSGATYKLTTK